MDGIHEFSGGEMSAQDTTSARDTSRDSLFVMAGFRLADAEAEQPVRIRNLSSGGLMAEYAGAIDTGIPVELDVRGIGWVRGTVAWVSSGRIGVAFDRKIDPMAARKSTGGATRPPQSPGLVVVR